MLEVLIKSVRLSLVFTDARLHTIPQRMRYLNIWKIRKGEETEKEMEHEWLV